MEHSVSLLQRRFLLVPSHPLVQLIQFSTFITEIEATLNWRPLTALSDTINSPSVLRPVDFLLPQVQLQLPSSSPSSSQLELSNHRLVEWHQETVAALDRFWTIWSTDYLTAISERHSRRISQGKSTPRIPQIGEVVLIGDKSTPRGTWPMAIIIRLSKDRAHQIRSATVRTSNGNELQRSIQSAVPSGDRCIQNNLRYFVLCARSTMSISPTSTNVSLSTSTQTTTSRQAPTSLVIQSVSTSIPSSETQNPLNLSEEALLTVSAIRDLKSSVSLPPFFAPIYCPLVHPFSDDKSTSSTPHRSTRHPTTLEFIYRYSTGHYSDEDISRLEDDRSQDISIPPQDRLPLRIAQSLTLAVNFDTTFSLEYLANRDLCFIDAFLHHRFFTSIRETSVDEAIIPPESDLDYPPVRNFSLALIVHNFKALHHSSRCSSSFLRTSLNTRIGSNL
ncbi:hypothetical protein OSTOST_04349 [Ostertagia ostertagi]